MKDLDVAVTYDTTEDRSFTIRGVSLVCKPTMPAQLFSRFADWNEEFDRLRKFPPQSFDVLNELIRGSLDKDSRDRWDVLIGDEDADVPIDLDAMLEVIGHIAATGARRPTRQLSPSGTTDGSDTTKSTGGSDSPVALAPEPSISQAS